MHIRREKPDPTACKTNDVLETFQRRVGHVVRDAGSTVDDGTKLSRLRSGRNGGNECRETRDERNRNGGVEHLWSCSRSFFCQLRIFTGGRSSQNQGLTDSKDDGGR